LLSLFHNNLDVGHKEDIFYYESGKALEQVAQRTCGCPFAGSVQGQIGWGFEQPGLAEGLGTMAGVLD